EQAIHQLRRLLVLERLVRHHVAPVAGRIPYRQQYRLAALPRQGESLFAPGIPVDRVRGVLQQVRTRLLRQPIAMLLPVLHEAPAVRLPGFTITYWVIEGSGGQACSLAVASDSSRCRSPSHGRHWILFARGTAFIRRGLYNDRRGITRGYFSRSD